MKRLLFLILSTLIISCIAQRSSAIRELSPSMKFQEDKWMVLCLSAADDFRSSFESEMRQQLEFHEVHASTSVSHIPETLKKDTITRQKLVTFIESLPEKGFDAVLISAVKGVDTNQNYSRPYYTVDYRWTRFGRYYYRYQDVYYHPGYYNQFKVYHIETSFYKLVMDEAKTKSLVWVGTLDLVDPQDLRTTINDYVAAIMTRLEKDNVLGVIQ